MSRLAAFLFWVLISCGDMGSDVTVRGSSCSVTQVKDGSKIVCTDGTSTFVPNGKDGVSVVFTVMVDESSQMCPNGGQIILSAYDSNANGSLDVDVDTGIKSAHLCNGVDGKDGVNGQDGKNGIDGVNGTNGTDGTDGKDGVNGIDGKDGKDGADGTNGADGQDGKDGQNGTDGKDGKDGVNGKDGTSSMLPVQIMNPCGDSEDVADQILIKLADGTIITSLSDKANGQNTRLIIMTPGSYITTDGDKCHFTIDNHGNLTDQHH